MSANPRKCAHTTCGVEIYEGHLCDEHQRLADAHAESRRVLPNRERVEAIIAYVQAVTGFDARAGAHVLVSQAMRNEALAQLYFAFDAGSPP